VGGKQSIEAGSSTNVKPSLARDDRSPFARFGPLYSAYESFSRAIPEVNHSWLIRTEFNHLEIEEK
jgi:hypothetical protein